MEVVSTQAGEISFEEEWGMDTHTHTHTNILFVYKSQIYIQYIKIHPKPSVVLKFH